MSNTKYFADLIKVCSVLHVFAVMPAMAGEYRVAEELTVSEDAVVSGVHSWMDVTGGYKYSAVWFASGADVSVASGAVFSNNKVGSGVFYTSVSNPASLTLNPGVTFENNIARFDGGGVANFSVMQADGVIFRNNSAALNYEEDDYPSVGGGAIALGAESQTVIRNSLFDANTSRYHGGAIAMRGPDGADNSEADLDIFESRFVGNKADINGGAIYSTFYDSETVKDSVYIYDTDFVLNSANNGGAIYTEGLADLGGGFASMKIVDADFEGNTATESGGAIYNGSNMTLVDVDFENNVSANGGAIFNKGVLTVNGDSEFVRNTVTLGGGAIYNGLNAITDYLLADFKFNSVERSNSGDASGGAIYNGGTIGSIVGAFNENVAIASDKSLTAKGGAIYSWADKSAHATIDSIVADFNGNRVVSAGDAIGGAIVNDGKIGTLYQSSQGFVNNMADAQNYGLGGAFHNSEYATIDELVADFVGNSATASVMANGGALMNRGHIDLLTGRFENNSVTNAQYVQGGAIYNATNPYDESAQTAELTIVDSVFANNFVDSVSADWAEGGAIYNELDSFITMKGTNTFTGNTVNGVANDIYNDGTLTIASGTTSIDGGINGAEGALDIQSGATLNMNYASIEQKTINIDGTLMASLRNANDTVDITGDLFGTGKVLLNVGATGTYDLGDLKAFVKEDSFGTTYVVSLDENNVATLTVKQVAEIAKETGITDGAAGAVSALAVSADAKLQTVSLAIQEALNSGDVAVVEKEMAKVNPDSKPVGQSVAASVQGQVVSVAAGRMSSVGGGAMGRAGGDVSGAGFWAQGLVNKSKMGGAFEGHTTGFALGGDMLIDNVFTLGGGFAFNSTAIEADGRDTDVESNSVFAYAQYKPSAWYANATVNYTLSDYTDDARMIGDVVISNQYDTKAFGAQAMVGYDFASGVAPEFGLRYLYVSQEEHVDGLNRTIQEMNYDVLTGVAGLNYAFAIESDTAVKFSPSMRAAMTYDFMTPDSVATIVVPGASAYYVDIDSLSRLGGEFGIGLTAEYRGLELSLNYELDLHKDYTSQTGLFKFRYDF